MNRKALIVICVYASGKRLEERSVNAKNARGRPRPPRRDERSTRPFVSRVTRCFHVAIFETPNSRERSAKETLPSRFNVSRICFLVDEKPASSPPTSTSRGSDTDRRWRDGTIYLIVYKMDKEPGPSSAPWSALRAQWAKSETISASRLGRRGRWRRLSSTTPGHQDHDDAEEGQDRDRRDHRQHEGLSWP